MLFIIADDQNCRLGCYGYAGMPKTGPLSEAQARNMIRGSLAATSFLDAQVGRLLDELERAKLSEQTIVVFLGDHGRHLGKHGIWSKHTNFAAAAHAPPIIAAPGRKASGRRTAALVEFVDLYPMLAELCNLSAGANLDGASFLHLFDDPQAPHKQAVYHQYSRRMKEVGTAV